MKKMFKCGHSFGDGTNTCPICFGVDDGATILVEIPNLEGRKAVCDCGAERGSKIELPFFEYRPKRQTDSFYCGHAGWN